MFALFASVLLHLCTCSEGLEERCDQGSIFSTCPGSPVSCECQSLNRLKWTVTSTESGVELFMATYDTRSEINDSISLNNYTGFLCNRTNGTRTIENTVLPFVNLSSKLNFTMSEDINVTCDDNMAQVFGVPLRIAGEYKIMLRSSESSDSCQSISGPNYSWSWGTSCGSHKWSQSSCSCHNQSSPDQL